MVEKAFEALSPWFAAIVNKIQTEYKKGVTPNDNKDDTFIRLGKLAGQVTAAKNLILDYATSELGAKPDITLDNFVRDFA